MVTGRVHRPIRTDEPRWAPQARRSLVSWSSSRSKAAASQPTKKKTALAALDKLDEMAMQRALAQSRDPHASALGPLLRAMEIPRTKQEKLVRAYFRHEGSIEGFWKAACSRREFADLSDHEVDSIQLGLQLGVVQQNHVPMVRALRGEGVATVRDLATLTKKDWLRLIKQRRGSTANGVPDVDGRFKIELSGDRKGVG